VNSHDTTEVYVDRLGQVAFFSHTPVKNIEAMNKQVSSVLNIGTGEVEVNLLMKAFVFEKEAMFKHFNEYYTESDLYPTASFSGTIVGFENDLKTQQVRMIKGELTLKGTTVPLDIKAVITPRGKVLTLTGKTKIKIKDFNIEIPELFTSYITESIEVSFDFEYEASI
jgi:polyisoprenoid-binding protein YceI